MDPKGACLAHEFVGTSVLCGRETDSMEALPRKGNRPESLIGDQSSDEQLLIQIRNESPEALNHLFRRYGRGVRDIAYRVLHDHAEADDLVQDVFLYIFRKASLYNSARGRASSWIIHIAYHRAFDRRRYLRARNFYLEEGLGEENRDFSERGKSEVPFLDRSIEGTLGRDLAGRLWSCLTSEQYETIHLFFFEDYTLKEISELTGRPIMNVRSFYYRGLERLRKFILSEKNRTK
jgi:RNA polymerase sigma-70 factor, ECF subfamily